MKFAVLLLFIISFSSFAQTTISPKYMCKDPEVVLTKFEVPCKVDTRLDEEFDIPDFKINIDDLDKIFEKYLLGADSSGGLTTDPSSRPASMPRRRSQLDFSINLNCEARLLTDGQKKLSFLSIQKFNLNKYTNVTTLNSANWKHFLVEENVFYPAKKYEVTSAPKVKHNIFRVKISNPNKNNHRKPRLELSICDLKTSSRITSNLVCAENERSIRVKSIKAHLKMAEISLESGFTITKKLQVRCTRY